MPKTKTKTKTRAATKSTKKKTAAKAKTKTRATTKKANKKKPSVKKAAAKKAPAKKATTKKSTTKKATAKKATAKKATATKKGSAKTTTKKAASGATKAKTKAAKKTAKSSKPTRAAKAAPKVPAVGSKAPGFALPDQTGRTVKLDDFRGKSHVVLYFYPKDNTPGCTKEACDFRDKLSQAQGMNAVVIGVSPDSPQSHQKFIETFQLPFSLLADEDHKVAESYGVWVQKNNYGRTYMGIQRATFLINKQGQVAASWPKVRVEGHVDDVLQALRDLNQPQSAAI